MSDTEMTLSDRPAIATSQSVEDILLTCPPEKRESFASTARRVLNGPRQRQAAIRIKCLECCAWQIAEVTNCHINGCALWGLRR
jgi:hypothetical protein